MNADCFVDTNVLVYAAAGRDGESAKRERALELLESANFALSAQVLQEFYVTVVCKLRPGLSPEAAMDWLDQLTAFPCVAIDAPLVQLAVASSETHRISYWDGAIVAAAEVAGATTLYTEDLNDGQRYGSVIAVNPFARH